ncbi:MAG: nucleoside/nucleotide kinase family protein [Fimbriimonadaceae bacterium]
MVGAFDPVSYLSSRTEARFVLGVTGPPGAGKSTFGAWLAAKLGAGAIVLPMDGFHFSNAYLDAQGSRARKGAPDTYDVAAFKRVLKMLRTGAVVSCPAYSRVTHEPQADAISIKPAHRFVIVEGNYLLVDTPPWNEVRHELDEIWYLDVTPELAAERLRRRHRSVGRTAAQAEIKVNSVDLPNGDIVRATRSRANRRLATFDPDA